MMLADDDATPPSSSPSNFNFPHRTVPGPDAAAAMLLAPNKNGTRAVDALMALLPAGGRLRAEAEARLAECHRRLAWLRRRPLLASRAVFARRQRAAAAAAAASACASAASTAAGQQVPQGLPQGSLVPPSCDLKEPFMVHMRKYEYSTVTDHRSRGTTAATGSSGTRSCLRVRCHSSSSSRRR